MKNDTFDAALAEFYVITKIIQSIVLEMISPILNFITESYIWLVRPISFYALSVGFPSKQRPVENNMAVYNFVFVLLNI